MVMFRRSGTARSTMFVVTYDDGRTAYLWLDDHGKGDDHRVGAIARERQQQGALPDGVISGIKRVR
jgi:hypothetical protein